MIQPIFLVWSTAHLRFFMIGASPVAFKSISTENTQGGLQFKKKFYFSIGKADQKFTFPKKLDFSKMICQQIYHALMTIACKLTLYLLSKKDVYFSIEKSDQKFTFPNKLDFSKMICQQIYHALMTIACKLILDLLSPSLILLVPD